MILVAALVGAACSSDDNGGNKADAAPQPGTPDAAPPGTPDAAPPGTPDAEPPEVQPHTWAPIIKASWTLQPGQEKYVCASVTLTEDVYIGGYRPIAPLGTHHTVLTYGTAGAPDDPGHDCSAGTENPYWIYASGVGTNELKLPTGVGVKIAAGQQVQVNLHLFNTSDSVISGTSGIEVYHLEQAEVVNEAEMFLPGPVGFQIPAGNNQQVTGNCTLHANTHLVALFPHMHQLGKHIKTEVVHAGGSTEVLHDDDYAFDNQVFEVLNDVQAASGDKIRTTCTYNNTTGTSVPFGQSSTQEMCFSILIRWPKQGAQGAQGTLCPI